MLTQKHQQMLKLTAHAIKNNPNENARALELDAIVSYIRVNQPDAFHNYKTLAERRFFDQPKQIIPYLSYINAAPREVESYDFR